MVGARSDKAWLVSENPKQACGDKKPPFQTIPSSALLEMGATFGDGARKYGAFNWRTSGVQAMTYVGAIHRHLAAYADGEDVDPESASGSSHLAAIMACAAILIDCRSVGNLIDNRPPPAPTGERIRYFQQHGKLPPTSRPTTLATDYVDVAGGE